MADQESLESRLNELVEEIPLVNGDREGFCKWVERLFKEENEEIRGRVLKVVREVLGNKEVGFADLLGDAATQFKLAEKVGEAGQEKLAEFLGESADKTVSREKEVGCMTHDELLKYPKVNNVHPALISSILKKMMNEEEELSKKLEISGNFLKIPGFEVVAEEVCTKFVRELIESEVSECETALEKIDKSEISRQFNYEPFSDIVKKVVCEYQKGLIPEVVEEFKTTNFDSEFDRLKAMYRFSRVFVDASPFKEAIGEFEPDVVKGALDEVLSGNESAFEKLVEIRKVFAYILSEPGKDRFEEILKTDDCLLELAREAFKNESDGKDGLEKLKVLGEVGSKIACFKEVLDKFREEQSEWAFETARELTEEIKSSELEIKRKVENMYALSVILTGFPDEIIDSVSSELKELRKEEKKSIAEQLDNLV